MVDEEVTTPFSTEEIASPAPVVDLAAEIAVLRAEVAALAAASTAAPVAAPASVGSGVRTPAVDVSFLSPAAKIAYALSRR